MNVLRFGSLRLRMSRWFMIAWQNNSNYLVLVEAAMFRYKTTINNKLFSRKVIAQK